LCSFLTKVQEEQTTSAKASRMKLKEKPEQSHETQKEKRRMAFRKGTSGGTAGTIAPLSDIDQNNFSGQHSQEKLVRWASPGTWEGDTETPS
jgi:hydrocephalus-inducing protein